MNPFLSTNDQEKGSDELLNGLMNSEFRSIVEWMNEVESSWILNSNLFSRWFLQVSMIESGQKLVLWPLLFDWHFLYFKACFWVRKLGKMVNHGCLGCVTSFQWWKNTSILLIQFKVQLLSNWVPWKQTVCSKVYKIWPTNKIFWPFFL